MDYKDKLIIVLLNYLEYMKVPVDELLDYLLGKDDDDGKRQLYLLLDLIECMDEVIPFKPTIQVDEIGDDFELEI